jgi:hypothetical protein
MNAIYQTSNGALVSVGSVVANPLPAGLTSVALSVADAQGLRDGSRTWDAATRTVVATPGFLDPAVAQSNSTTLRQQADAALATNRTFIAIASPTNAQNAAQIKALSRQNNGIIRLVIDKLDGTD